MFDFREFVKGGLIRAVGRMADHAVILNAAAWYEKGVLLESDLEEIQQAVEEQYVEDTAPLPEVTE